MEKIIQAIEVLWPLFLAAIGFTVWLIRLEGKNDGNKTRLSDLRKDFDEYRDKTDKELVDMRNRITAIDSELMRQISDVRESLARIEGALGISKKV